MDVKQLRVDLGLTQQELSALTGIGTASIARWETGTHKPNEAMKRLLLLLEVSEAYEGLERYNQGKTMSRMLPLLAENGQHVGWRYDNS